MHIKFATPLFLAISLLIAAQPSFAMKRSHSGSFGHSADQALAMIETASSLVAILATSPFALLPNEVLHVIFRWVGPQGRLLCRVVNRQFWDFLSSAQMPASEGFGWTDTLPVVITPQVGWHEEQVFEYGGIEYTANFHDNSLVIIDPNANDGIQIVELSLLIFKSTAVGEMVYMSDPCGTTIKVLHRNSRKVIGIIEVGQLPHAPIPYGGMLYVVSGVSNDDHILSVIDPVTNQVIVEAPLPDFVENGELAYVIHGQLLILFGDRCVAIIHLGGYLPGQH